MNAERADWPKKEKELVDGIPIVVVSGPIAAGKGTIAQIIKNNFGFSHFVVSDVLKNYLHTQGITQPYTRLQVSNLAKDLQQDYGKLIIIRMELKEIESVHNEIPLQGAVVEGVRYVEEALHLKQFSNIALIWVDAPRAVRFERMLSRGRPGEVSEYDEFAQRDGLEAQWMKGIKEASHLLLQNQGTTQDLADLVIPFVSARYRLNL